MLDSMFPLLRLLLVSPGSVREMPWRTWPFANSSRSSSGSARGRGCEARIVCSGCDCPGPGRIGRVLVIVRPETVVSWHRKGFRLFWAWISRRRRTGRPQASREITALIRKMATANPFWGATRIHGELLKLGILISERPRLRSFERLFSQRMYHYRVLARAWARARLSAEARQGYVWRLSLSTTARARSAISIGV